MKAFKVVIYIDSDNPAITESAVEEQFCKCIEQISLDAIFRSIYVFKTQSNPRPGKGTEK